MIKDNYYKINTIIFKLYCIGQKIIVQTLEGALW